MTLVTNLHTANPSSPSGKYAVSLCSYARPNDATIYTALDVISDDLEARALAFPGCGRSGAIRGVSLSNTLETDTITPRLWIFDSEPTNHADNVALALVAADLPKIVGVFDFDEADKFTVGTNLIFYSATHATAASGTVLGPIPYSSDGGNLYGLLQTVTGYTPIASSAFLIRLMVEHD